jgi:serine kinase of HPr protein (carbohydrate metabolism regulator)
MSLRSLSSETLHVSAVAIEGRAVLIGGRSGQGKSDLALRLIDRGALLISDDYTFVRREGGRLLASSPPQIEGKIEVRGLGILELPFQSDVPVALFVDLDRAPERLPVSEDRRKLAGVDLPGIALSALEASAPIKVEAALKMIGLTF